MPALRRKTPHLSRRFCDSVLSYNETTRFLEFRDVIAKFTRAADDVYELDVEGEARPLGVTGEHPFFVRTYRARDSLISPDDDGEWKETRNLRSGDEIRLANGRWARVSGVRFKGPGVVYNFTVEGNHNYFVGGSGLLTPNVGCGPFDEILANSELVKTKGGDGLEYVLKDGTKVFMHPDKGPLAHAIGKKYPNPVDHWNIVIQTPGRSPGRFNQSLNYHLILDKAGSVIDIFVK